MVNDAHDPSNDHDRIAPGALPEGAPGTAAGVAEVPGAAPGKQLSPEARRALEEAEARRRAAPVAALPSEIGGRDGEEPTRYGDWERKGLAVDF
jgi:hypothetical protein